MYDHLDIDQAVVVAIGTDQGLAHETGVFADITRRLPEQLRIVALAALEQQQRLDG